MTKIYVVIGKSGEYSDRTEWLVKSFYNEEDAKQHVLNAERIARDIERRCDSDYEGADKLERYDLPQNINPYDPQASEAWGECRYHYEITDIQ